MSRSQYHCWCSEKKDKQIWHRYFRHKSTMLTNSCDFRELDSCDFPKVEEVSDPWGMSKDSCYGYSRRGINVKNIISRRDAKTQRKKR